MKRMIMAGIMMLLMIGIVMAQDDSERIDLQERTHEQVREQFRVLENHTEDEFHPGIQGLEQARILVTNQVAANRIDDNIERLQERERLVLQNLQNTSFALGENDTVVARGEANARFLGIFPVQRQSIFAIQDGELVRLRRPADALFRYEEQVRNIPEA